GALALVCVAPAALAQASAQASAPAASPTWALDPTHTFVHWEILHMGTSTIRGRFSKVTGNVQFDPKAQLLDVSIAVDTASVSSGVPILDALLKGSAMLDSTAQPQAFFVARNATFDGEKPRELRGEFTLRGTSQPLTLRALRWNCGLNPLFRRTVCGGDFEAEIVRSSFGITHSLPFVADKVRLIVQVEAISP
ncbi:MAG TPA: YceI family protein, partial [Burkholderiaceae bacterium]